MFGNESASHDILAIVISFEKSSHLEVSSLEFSIIEA